MQVTEAPAIDLETPGGPLLRVPALGAALPDAALAVTFLTAWIAPASLPAGTGGWLLLTMIVEFIVMHSAAFMGKLAFAPLSRTLRVRGMLGFAGLYMMFILAMAKGFHAWWPVWSFTLLTLNRLASVLFGQPASGDEQAFVARSWAVSGILYLSGVALTLFAPLPRLGVDAAAIARWHLPGSGAWVSQPWRVLAFGAYYFGLTALSELNGHRWVGGGVKTAA